MSYVNPKVRGRGRLALRGFGDFNDETPCTSVPIGDPYRKPGNYCAVADGGYTTFNSDGTVYTGSSSSAPSTSIWDKLGSALSNAVGQPPTVMPGMTPVVPHSGMSTTTMIALAGGAVLLAVLIARR